MVYQYWSVSERSTALAMQDAGHPPREIAAAIGRSANSVANWLRKLDPARKSYLRQYRPSVIHTPVPATVFEDRDRRANEPRTLSQELLGDPPFSQSALARSLPRVGQSKAEKAYETGPTYLDPASAA